MKRIYGLLAVGLLMGCSPSKPQQGGKKAEQAAAPTQMEEKAVAQEATPAQVSVTPSK